MSLTKRRVLGFCEAIRSRNVPAICSVSNFPSILANRQSAS